MQNRFNDEEDVSMYYPDGDSAHMEQDDHDQAFINQNNRKKKRVRKKNARLTKGQITLIAVMFVVYTAVIFGAAWLIFYKPAQPGPNEIPFDTNPVETQTPDTPPPLDGQETAEPVPPPASEKDPAEDAYTVREGVYNILVIGHDDTALLADVVMLVNCDTTNQSISVMQLPRDTLVTLDLLTNKLNESFSSFYMNAKHAGHEDPYTEAGQKMAELLETSLCVNIHHTVIVGLSGFRNVVDAVGGVDVYVPHAMHYEDPEQDLYINIGEGMQHLDGYNAERFIRFRDGYVQADLGRVNAQKIFLTAMFNKVKALVKSVDVATLSSLANAVFDSVNTDLTVSDILYYAKFLMNVNLDAIHMMTVPGDVAGSFYVLNRMAALETVNQYFNIYTKEITDSIFDRNYTFCFTDQQYLCDVYFSQQDMIFGEVFDGESIDDESIYIPRK